MKNKIIPYDELGFRVYLIDPIMHTLPDGTQIPAPNMRLLQDNVFKILAQKQSRFTGNEVHFIRKYMHMTQMKFAALLNLANHSIVPQWENKDDTFSGMDYNTEILLRLHIEASIYITISLEHFRKLTKLSNKSEKLYVKAV